MERGTYPILWQWNGKVYLTHLMSAKWKYVLTPPCGSEVEIDTYPTLLQRNGKRLLTPPCGS